MKNYCFNGAKTHLFNVAIVGATGLVGRKVLSELERLSFPVKKIYLFASAKSDGKTLTFRDKPVTVSALDKNEIPSDIDFAFFCAGGKVSGDYALSFMKKGCVVIDNSSLFRLKDGVPLVVPGVNDRAAFSHKGLIANPNCSTIQECAALKPLSDAFGIERVVVSTYQAVSGAGQKGILDLARGKSSLPPEKFDKPIFNDCLPKIDDFTPSGYTKEELKIICETRKILGLKDLRITATAVRVPLLNCHSENLNVELKSPYDEEKIKAALSSSPLLKVVDEPEKCVYPTCRDADGKGEVFIGRIRRDHSVKSGLNMWVVADNLLRGAATNAVEIALLLVRERQKEKE